MAIFRPSIGRARPPPEARCLLAGRHAVVSNPARGASFHSIQFRLAIAALLGVATLGWAWLYAAEQAMASMRGEGLLMGLMRAMMAPGDSPAYLLASATMWLVMMMAMMTPAALPMLLVFRGLDRGPAGKHDAVLFASAYLASWSVFAVLAALAQWWLHGQGYLHGPRLAASHQLAGGILIAAGIWQLTPFKAACLAHCRGPLGFFLAHWCAGRWGAIAMGLRHGTYCIGCCWMLMALMFAGGAMSVATMAALAVFILAERVLPGGKWVTCLPGIGLIVFGGVLIASV